MSRMLMPDPCVSLGQHKRDDQSQGVCVEDTLSCLQNMLESSLLRGCISELWGRGGYMRVWRARK